MTAKINIDNKEYEVDSNKNVLETCLSLGLNLPYFCWHPAMESVGACRQCAIIMYKDEKDDQGKIFMACMEPIKDGMRISLEAPEAKKFRAGNIEALMTNHPHDCPVCDEGGECHLQDMTIMTGHTYRRFRFPKRTYPNQYLGPFVEHEMNRCIQCYRCVRFYKEYAGGKDLDVFAAHNNLYFGRQEPGILENEFSGNLVEVCPTGVFTDKTLRKHFTRKWDLTNAPSICHNCSLGCNIIASERYGSIRRILTRYNGDVNGYFLCDRGRFGYEYINSKERITSPLKRNNEVYDPLTSTDAIQEIKQNIIAGKNIIGIGSPKASLESNFMLRKLVGANNFYGGIPKEEGKLIQLILKILRSGKVKSPSLADIKDYDAVFILGEDVTNTAPMMALNLRQAAKNKPDRIAQKLKIPLWESQAVHELDEFSEGPFYIATPTETKLDEIATCHRAQPDDIARLGFSVVHYINNAQQEIELAEHNRKLAKAIADDLLKAEKPLIVAGTSLFSKAIIECAANIAFSLKEQGKEVGISYIVQEVNSMGLSIIADKFLEDAFQSTKQEAAHTVVILENDLYFRSAKEEVDSILNSHKNIVVLDYLKNSTTQKANYILPAGTFAEADGTVINNEGRAQRFYKVYLPNNTVHSSWQWLHSLSDKNNLPDPPHIEDVVANLIVEFPELTDIIAVAPDREYRKDTQKIPREPSRYSGRTAMNAEIDVNEPQTPIDNDSALSFSMEGYQGIPPPALTPYYRRPGWNSVQAINKYQIEVGGELHGGNPGIRVFNSKENSGIEYFKDIPEPFVTKEGQWQAFPIYHIFGSDYLSSQSPAIGERVPLPYIIMRPDDTNHLAINEDNMLEMEVNDKKYLFPVRFQNEIPSGTIGIPYGLEATKGLEFPFWTTLKKIHNE